MIRGALCLIVTHIGSDYNRHDIGLNLLWATIATVIKVMVKCQHLATDRPAAGWLDGLLDGADVSGRTRSQQHHSLVPPDSGCSVSLYYKLPLPVKKPSEQIQLMALSLSWSQSKEEGADSFSLFVGNEDFVVLTRADGSAVLSGQQPRRIAV